MTQSTLRLLQLDVQKLGDQFVGDLACHTSAWIQGKVIPLPAGREAMFTEPRAEIELLHKVSLKPPMSNQHIASTGVESNVAHRVDLVEVA